MTLRQRNSAEPLPASARTDQHLWCEILPIALYSGKIMYVRRGQDTTAAWYEPYYTGAHPSDVVRARVEAFFGTILDPSASVVHSTAWRYECGNTASGRIILTYLAVLPPICCTPNFSTGYLSLQPIETDIAARSGTLGPPERVMLQHVLAHALDHLTLLLETDLAIARVLGPQWRAALERRQRRPAGELRLAHAAPDDLVHLPATIGE